VTCSFCGTELPTGALFCGECGRAVDFASAASTATPRERLAHNPVHRSPSPGVDPGRGAPGLVAPSLVEPGLFGEGPHGRGPSGRTAADTGPLSCAQCGAAMAEDDIFCGECGFVSRAASEDFGRSRDTAVIEFLPPRGLEPKPAAPLLVDRLPRFDAAAQTVSDGSRPDPASPAAPFDDSADVEATRLSRAGQAGERFVLQFSTGESVIVYGTGLIGRNPRPEPGEFFDQLVRVLDPSRSVSKVHLEFGQDAGTFWIKDRFSGNGTVVREPDSVAVRCQPEKRFRVTRGTRVEIGEQFFIVS
jgi:hypothetical protein